MVVPAQARAHEASTGNLQSPRMLINVDSCKRRVLLKEASTVHDRAAKFLFLRTQLEANAYLSVPPACVPPTRATRDTVHSSLSSSPARSGKACGHAVPPEAL